TGYEPGRILPVKQDMASCFIETKSPEKALALIEPLVSAAETQPARSHASLALSLQICCRAAMDLERFEQALEYSKRRRREVEAVAHPDPLVVRDAILVSAICYSRMKRQDEAISAILEASRSLRSDPKANAQARNAVLKWAKTVCDAAGKPVPDEVLEATASRPDSAPDSQPQSRSNR